MTATTTPRDLWTAAAAAWWTDRSAAGEHPNLAAADDGPALNRFARHCDGSPWTLDTETLSATLDHLGPAAPAVTLTLHRFYTWAIATGRVRRSPLDPTTFGAWAQAVTAFTEHLERLSHPTPETRADYVRRVFTYGRTLPAGPWDLDESTLAADLDDRNWSLHTRRATLVALRRFYAWAVKSGRVQRSPLAGIPDGHPNRPGPLQQDPADAWAEAVGAYLTTLRAAGRRPGTVNMRRGHLTMLSQTFGDPWAVTTDDLALYLSNPDWRPEYRRSVRGSLRLFYRWAVLTERLQRDPSVPLLPVAIPRALPRPAPDDAVLTALENADERTRLAIELGIYAGLRIAEVVQLGWADIQPDCLHVTGKGGNQRVVPLHRTLADSLAAERSRRLAAGRTSPWLFPSTAGGHLAASTLGRHVAEALPDKWTHHTLRHRFATQAYATDRDIRAVQELLGHVRPETTARYAAVPQNALISAVAGVGLILDRNRTTDR